MNEDPLLIAAAGKVSFFDWFGFTNICSSETKPVELPKDHNVLPYFTPYSEKCI